MMNYFRAASQDVADLLAKHGLTGWAHKVQIEGWVHPTKELDVTFIVSIVRTCPDARPECLTGRGPTLDLALGELQWRIAARDAVPAEPWPSCRG